MYASVGSEGGAEDPWRPEDADDDDAGGSRSTVRRAPRSSRARPRVSLPRRTRGRRSSLPGASRAFARARGEARTTPTRATTSRRTSSSFFLLRRSLLPRAACAARVDRVLARVRRGVRMRSCGARARASASGGTSAACARARECSRAAPSRPTWPTTAGRSVKIIRRVCRTASIVLFRRAPSVLARATRRRARREAADSFSRGTSHASRARSRTRTRRDAVAGESARGRERGAARPFGKTGGGSGY
jgi:hypothetical protein